MKYLKNKLTLSVSLMMAVAIALLTVTSSLLYYRSSTAQSEEYSAYLAKAYRQGIEAVMDSYRSRIRSAAAESFLTDGKTPEAEQTRLLNAEASLDGFNYLAVADEMGDNNRNDNISGLEFFRQVKLGKIFISDPEPDTSNKMVFRIAAPIGSTGKILYGAFSYSALSKELSQIKIGDDGYAFAINNKGQTVIHPNEDNVRNPKDYFTLSKKDASYLPIANIYYQMVAGKSGTAYSNYGGTRRLVGFTPLSGPEGWSVAVTIPVTQLDQNLRITLGICVAAGLLLLLVCIVISRVLSGKITKPIVTATSRLELLAEGDLSEDFEAVSGRDEGARLMLALQDTVHGLRTYISDISHVLGAVAEKDLTARSSVEYRGDFVPIHDALEQITASLRQTLQSIGHATEEVRSGSEQVSAGSQSLAGNSTEQAATADRLTESLGLVSGQVRDNTEYSAAMQDRTRAAMQETERGNSEMQQMLQSMNDIDSAAKQIQGIIGLIDSIAFQTNILALNAAVEAARAGEAGKGFSVVADEVRQLASKSAQAAKDTAALIENALRSVGTGIRTADSTAEAFRKIVEQTDGINTLVGRMSDSLRIQSETIAELEGGIRQIASVTQANSAAAEESAATSEELLGQTQALDQMVSEFITD